MILDHKFLHKKLTMKGFQNHSIIHLLVWTCKQNKIIVCPQKNRYEYYLLSILMHAYDKTHNHMTL